MSPLAPTTAATEARRVAELARSATYGDSPDVAVQRHRDALILLGSHDLTPLHADTLRWEGTVLRDRGRTSDAQRLYDRSLEIARHLRYERGIAHALNCLAGLAIRRGELMIASELFTDALALADRCSELPLVAMIQSNLGIIADMRGDTEKAIEHFHVALDVAETVGDEQQVVRVLLNFSVLLIAQRRYGEADRAVSRGLLLAKARGELYYEGFFEENRAEMHLARGELEEAEPAIARALAIAEQRRDDVRKAAALKLRGACERLTGRLDAATDTLRYAATLAAVGEDALLGAEVMYQFGLALFDGKDEPLAREAWRTALDAFERISARDWIERVRERLTTGSTVRYM
jgi:tetratricopeptide (TPR) repeat protein